MGSEKKGAEERKRAEEELAKHREHLEELVRERTAEREEKNRELERHTRGTKRGERRR